MALVNCKECSSEVSDSALKCPKCGVQLRKPKRGFFGFIFKWMFILFNILMLIWAISGAGSISQIETNSAAEEAGVAIGATLGFGLIFGVWVIGDIILGLLVLFTRPKS